MDWLFAFNPGVIFLILAIALLILVLASVLGFFRVAAGAANATVISEDSSSAVPS